MKTNKTLQLSILLLSTLIGSVAMAAAKKEEEKTFSYENEYAVIAAEEKILDQIVSIYDIYLGALRNLLGQEILN